MNTYAIVFLLIQTKNLANIEIQKLCLKSRVTSVVLSLACKKI